MCIPHLWLTPPLLLGDWHLRGIFGVEEAYALGDFSLTPHAIPCMLEKSG